MYCERLTVKKLKQLLKAYNVPDDAIVCCQSDEEGNQTMVCMDMYIDRVGRVEEIRSGYGIDRFVQGSEVLGIDQEKDKDKIFITFRPMY